MKLVLLGTSGYHPNDRRETACLMLPEIGVVLDAGSAMHRLGQYLKTDRLDIFLTHAHLDHIVGLTYLLDVVPCEMISRIAVHAEPAKLDAIRKHLFAELSFPLQLPFDYRPLEDEVEIPQAGRLTHFTVQHPGGAVGFRLNWSDRSMAYVTDTTAAEGADYIQHIRGVDVLVHEAYFSSTNDEMAAVTGHSCIVPAAKAAAEAEADATTPNADPK